MAEKKKAKRVNTFFRQTPREFKSAHQAQIFSHINRNLPYKIYQFSKSQFEINLIKLKRQYNKIKTTLPKYSKKIR